MDGLEALTSPVGPSMAGFNAGQETGRKYEEQLNQQALRQAQTQEIMQNMKQRELTNPIDVQAKQLKLKQDQLTAAIQQNDAYVDFLGKAGAVLENIPALPGQRHAILNNMLSSSGIDVKNAGVQQVMKQLEQVAPDQIPKVLTNIQSKLIQQSAEYRKAMDVAKEHSRSAENVARINATSRENLVANKPTVSFAKFNALSPDKRIGVVSAALESGIDPVTNTEMTDAQRAQYTKMLQTDAEILNAQLAARQQGGVVPTVRDGKVQIENKPVAQIGKSVATKSGTKYTILPSQ